MISRMYGIAQPTEWVWIGLLVLVLFGGSQIPKLARSLGQAQKEFKSGLSEGFEDEAEGTVEKSS